MIEFHDPKQLLSHFLFATRFMIKFFINEITFNAGDQMKIVERVPNFSESRKKELIDA